MNFIGKLIGFIVGAFLLGPIGALLGIFFGHLYDRARQGPHINQIHNEGQQAFFDTTFAVMGHLAKSDGRVTESEINVARLIMQRMGLNEKQKRQAIDEFNRGKQSDFNVEANIQFMMRHCQRQRNLFKMFIEIQVQAAYAGGLAAPVQQQILQRICKVLGIAPLNFTLLNMLYGRNCNNYQQYQQHSYQQQSNFNAVNALDQCYALLEVSKSASDAEVKKAYRRMMSQNHPDKLVAKGLPEEMVKMATEKTQRIQKAYETICKARNMRK